jgi:hypothetical protein
MVPVLARVPMVLALRMPVVALLTLPWLEIVAVTVPMLTPGWPVRLTLGSM